MPPATAGPGPPIDAPVAGTPFTAVNARFVSKDQITSPVAVEYARRAPSNDPENTTPGITVSAADCAALQPRPAAQATGGGAAVHSGAPVATFTACRPPGCGCVRSDTAK